MAKSPETPSRPFDLPQEADWHGSIAEAAYYMAEKRGFRGEHSLDDWLAAEQQVRPVISPPSQDKGPVDSTSLRRPRAEIQSLEPAESANNSTSEAQHPGQSTSKQDGGSRFEQFASTQAAGDGIQGDALKKHKTVDEQIGANMADRK